MDPDDELCLCFHVTKRKVVNFLRIEKPKSATQLAGCYGAGTGCGWCRPFLEELFVATRTGDVEPGLPTKEEFARSRTSYVRAGKGSPPPGATPIDAE